MTNAKSHQGPIFHVREANEWIALSKEKPTPKFLFGEFWLEGELSILFADTGKGKSVLAVQIAESIARGVPIPPLRLTSGPQKVLYLDFELSDKQFELRYSRDISEDEDGLTGHYEFSPNFLRAEVGPVTGAADGQPGFDDELIEQIESEVERTGARVLIVDNITYLRSGAVRTAEAIRLMMRLKELKTERGLSILVLAHTPKRNMTWPLNVNDLQGSKVLSNFADNIFAIGQSRYDTSHRYIKHIKPRSTEMLYDAQHVPSFVLGKREGNFLSFSFFGWREEAVHLSNKFDSYRLKRADDMKRFAKLGHSQREIAERFGTSAASVNRHLQMWSPFDDEQERIRIEIEQQREQERRDAIRQKQFAEERAKREKERRKREAALRREDENADRLADKKPRVDPRLVSPEGKKLTESHDHTGTIYVEEFQDDGRAKIWYRYDRSGNRHRCIRKGSGIMGEIIERAAM